MRWVYKIEESVIGITMLVTTAVLFMNVVLRYFFNANTTWAEEFIRFAMIWITFVGSSVCFRKGMHVGIDLLLSFTSNLVSRMIRIVVSVLALIFMVFLIKYGIDLVRFSIQTGQITPAMEIPLFWVYLGIPIGSFLSFIHLLKITFDLLRNKVEEQI